MSKVWFITGTSRGLGLSLARAALERGDSVAATARRPETIAPQLSGYGDRLLPLALDVQDQAQADAAVAATLERFGRIDVLVNNAGYGHLGFFEEVGMTETMRQFETNLFGAFRVTWAALPAMRAARSGKIFNISSIGGVVGAPYAALYVSSKFALEGFSESLAGDVAPFGVDVTIVEPGPFRTEFLTPDSIRFGGAPIADYAPQREGLVRSFEARNGMQTGDPDRLAAALLELADSKQPPLRFTAGAAAWNGLDHKLGEMKRELDQWRTLSMGTDGDYADAIPYAAGQSRS